MRTLLDEAKDFSRRQRAKTRAATLLAREEARARTLARYQAKGFDMTEVEPWTAKEIMVARPKCSCCAVLVINGIACHETGCGNASHECKGCNAQIPMRQTYCEDCA